MNRRDESEWSLSTDTGQATTNDYALLQGRVAA